MCSPIGQNTPEGKNPKKRSESWGSECINERRTPRKGGSRELEVIESEEQ